MKKNIKALTGDSLPKSAFYTHVTEGRIDLRYVQQILQGKLAAYCIKNFVSPDCCQRIYHNFWASPYKTTRPGYGADGVEGYFIGASHIECSTDAYLTAVEQYKQATTELFTHVTGPISKLKTTLSCRTAVHDGRLAGEYKAVYWNSLGPFLLQPHEDLAQLSDPMQKGFEIQSVKRVMAANLYVSTPLQGGQLKLWNIEPSERSRDSLNLTHSGFPYPPELLEDHPNMTIPVQTGDLCLINGNLIHAVLRGTETVDAKSRLLLTFFSGINAQNELISWT